MSLNEALQEIDAKQPTPPGELESYMKKIEMGVLK